VPAGFWPSCNTFCESFSRSSVPKWNVTAPAQIVFREEID
jgi:hypothetical protein